VQRAVGEVDAARASATNYRFRTTGLPARAREARSTAQSGSLRRPVVGLRVAHQPHDAVFSGRELVGSAILPEPSPPAPSGHAARDQRLEHRPTQTPRRGPDHRQQLDLSALQQLLRPMLLRSPLPAQQPPVAGQVTPLPDRPRRSTTVASTPRPACRPSGARHILHVLGVEQPATKSLGLQQIERRLPAVARDLHRDHQLRFRSPAARRQPPRRPGLVRRATCLTLEVPKACDVPEREPHHPHEGPRSPAQRIFGGLRILGEWRARAGLRYQRGWCRRRWSSTICTQWRGWSMTRRGVTGLRPAALLVR
jgi:hypothetical protein